MKIAIVADIHANFDALKAVFTSNVFLQADSLLVAGDLLGYYSEPGNCLALLRSWKKPIYIVRGNHEEMLLASMHSDSALTHITERYGPGIRVALEQLSSSDLNWIERLPHPLYINDSECSILLCHGSPTSTSRYVYPDSSLKGIIDSLINMPDVLVMGHTHYPMARTVGNCLLVNPGSVGQPRNRIPGAHWALLDTKAMSVSFFVETYDVASFQSKCMAFAPAHPYLWEVLTRS